MTSRDIQIMTMIVQGHRTADIAKELNIGYATVRRDMTRIYRELGIKKRSEVTMGMVSKHSRKLHNAD